MRAGLAKAIWKARGIIMDGGFKPPIPISRIITIRHGASIHFKPLPANLPGFLLFLDGKYHICVNENDSLPRQQFTLAHELGHLELGHIKSRHHKVLGVEGFEDTPEERQEANEFAAEILLPLNWLQDFIRAETPIDVMAEELAVSYSMLYIQLKKARALMTALDITEEATRIDRDYKKHYPLYSRHRLLCQEKGLI